MHLELLDFNAITKLSSLIFIFHHLMDNHFLLNLGYNFRDCLYLYFLGLIFQNIKFFQFIIMYLFNHFTQITLYHIYYLN